MSERLTVGCVQLESGPDTHANIAAAETLLAEAVARGAELIVLPENWSVTGDPEQLRASAEEDASGPARAALARWARRFGVTIVGGSIIERDATTGSLFNTVFVVDPDGATIASYRKIHLFDVDVGGRRYRESEVTEPGSQLVVIPVGDWTIGITVCYDVRFPELYRALAERGADAIVVPAYFTVATGKDHRHLLLRARAVENQLYVLAAAQCGEPAPGKPAYGRSLVSDPWGTVLVQAGDDPSIVIAELERARIDAVRRSLPALAHRRPDVYASWLETGAREQ